MVPPFIDSVKYMNKATGTTLEIDSIAICTFAWILVDAKRSYTERIDIMCLAPVFVILAILHNKYKVRKDKKDDEKNKDIILRLYFITN